MLFCLVILRRELTRKRKSINPSAFAVLGYRPSISCVATPKFLEFGIASAPNLYQVFRKLCPVMKDC